VDFEPGDLARLQRFLNLLLEANKTTNLTAITDPAAAWMKHIFDALTLVPVLASYAEARGGEAPPVRVIDVGSGGGVPAIPLAIVMGAVEFTLVEATGKKAAFLEDALAALKLSNAHIVNARAEPLGQDHKAHREKYDIATARALGHLAVAAELCGPLVRPGGLVLAVKGAKADQELQEADKALGEIGLRHVETIVTPTGRIVVLEKTVRTPRVYPRRDGEPARAPLGIKGK
jgi:16S rRNA (guanine527-N7)-methyltransferase